MKTIIFALQCLLMPFTAFSQHWTVANIHDQIRKIYEIKAITNNFKLPAINTLASNSPLHDLTKYNQPYLDYILNEGISTKISDTLFAGMSVDDANARYHEILMNDANFIRNFTDAVAFYLVSKGIRVDGWNRTKTNINRSVYHVMCAQFFNRVYVNRQAINWELNTKSSALYETIDNKEDTLLLAFCRQAALYWVSKRKWNDKQYSSSFITKMEILNESVDVTNADKDRKRKLVSSMRDLIISYDQFREAMNSEYADNEAWLSFKIVD
ncbi:hypothetical protein CLV58_103166 [Spirosoma oryzae]|uniref:Uncharacterized protein n=1 Tax=Spirosoma oryzae TaxID=1469603 RepID=A0A2T0TEV5_9BACT|nr:hypothetical protein [Spirosoma oryzae]PRY44197.1 hypothetical protein CLV58_103166 [Spirosoma oryzae]